MAIDLKKMFSDTLIELCEEKSLSRITVSDICNRVGCSRQTFYNHFIDKDDLIIWIYRTRAVDAFDNFDGGLHTAIATTQTKLLKLSGFFRQAIKITGINSLSNFIYEDCVALYEEYICRTYGNDALTGELQFTIRFYAHGIAGIMIQQLSGTLVIEPEQKARYAIDCMPVALRRYFPEDE